MHTQPEARMRQQRRAMLGAMRRRHHRCPRQRDCTGAGGGALTFTLVAVLVRNAPSWILGEPRISTECVSAEGRVFASGVVEAWQQNAAGGGDGEWGSGLPTAAGNATAEAGEGRCGNGSGELWYGSGRIIADRHRCAHLHDGVPRASILKRASVGRAWSGARLDHCSVREYGSRSPAGAHHTPQHT